LENITTNSIEIPVSQIGTFKWAVSAQCTSGHVNWSEINENTLTGRLAANLSIQVYPNPTSKQMNVVVPNELQNAEYYILDVFGSIKMVGQFNTNLERIDLETLPSGWYTLRTLNGESKANFYKN